MGRRKGYKLSPERIQRMQMAKERRKLGYTIHLYVVEILANHKMEELFKKWHLDIEDSFFTVEGCDNRFGLIPNLQEKNVRFRDVDKKVIEYLEKKEVKEVVVHCADNKVLAETQETGNVVLIRKEGKDYFVADYDHF